MRAWRHLLLVASLVLAQLLVGAHAVEHAAGNDETLAAHACQLCLKAHDLGSALPSLASLPPVVLPQLVPASVVPVGRLALPAPLACQRGPPPAF